MNNIIINSYTIVGTNLHVYAAYEPVTPGRRHSEIAFFEDRCYGRIGSDPNPAFYEHLPAGSDERIQAARAAYRERFDFAYAEIIRQHPEVATGRRENGEIKINS